MRIAAAYLRVSTEKQDEYSLDSQLKLIRDYANKNDYIVPDEFVFVDDGISGRYASKRTAFQQMIGWAKDKSHPFEAILVWKFSRFARNQEESIVYKSMLSRCGVGVVSISEPLAEGPFGSLIERILEWMDEFYSIRLSGEVKRGMLERIQRGEIVCVPPFGYDIQGKTYVPNANADTVRRVYAEYLAGKGCRTIASDLCAEGFLTQRGKSPNLQWVEYLLQNPVYVGKLRWSKNGMQNYRQGQSEDSLLFDSPHEHIIDDDTWNAVQAKRAAIARRGVKYTRDSSNADWMLKGLVRCSNCGSTLIRPSIVRNSLQCNKYVKGNCNVSNSLKLPKANAAVIEALESAIATSTFTVSPKYKKPTEATVDYDKKISLCETRLRRVQEAYEAGVDTLSEYATKKAKIAEEIETLRKEKENATPKQKDFTAFKSKVAEVLAFVKDENVSEGAKNEALKSILTDIVYDKPNKKLILYFYA